SQIVPVYQAFGGGGYSAWILPTATQEQQILSTWGALVPNPAFDYAYSWGVQSSDTALENTPSLQSVFAAHNAVQAVSVPAAPSNLTATAMSTTEIDLAWTNNASNANGFVVNRSTDGVTFSQLAVLGNVTSYKDTGLSAGSKCYYEVAATNGAGTSAFSNVANATTSAVQVPPAAPSNLTATAVSTSEIDLSWTDNAAGNETGFLISRSTDGTTFTQIGSVGAGVTSYKNTGLSASTKYYYEVRATNAAGNSAFSNIANATTNALQSPPAAPSSLTATADSTSDLDLSWTDNAGHT